MAAPKRLGRGLGGLLASGGKAGEARPASASTPADEPAPAAPAVPEGARRAENGDLEVAVTAILPNPRQPRRDFDPDRLRELADSIRAEGLLQPVVVRALGGGRFELVAGERRWRAFQLLGLRHIPARIVEVGDASSAAAALIENLQREDLNPIDEALGLASLLRDFDLTQEQVAERVGRGRATIANALRLLQLSRELQGYVATGLLSAGHAKVLLGLEDEGVRQIAARRVIEDGLNVRQTEKLVERMRAGSPAGAPAGERPAAAGAVVADLERRLASHFNARVAIRHGLRRGRIVIEYQGTPDLNRILDRLGLGS